MKLVKSQNTVDSVIEMHREILNDRVTCLDPMVKVEISDPKNPWIHIETSHASDETQIVINRLDDIVEWMFGWPVDTDLTTYDYNEVADMVLGAAQEIYDKDEDDAAMLAE